MAVVSPPMPPPMMAARFTTALEYRVARKGSRDVRERSFGSKQIVRDQSKVRWPKLSQALPSTYRPRGPTARFTFRAYLQPWPLPRPGERLRNPPKYAARFFHL